MIKLVLCLARPAGLSCLRFVLGSPQYRVAALFTHRFEPRSPGSLPAERSDFGEFDDAARRGGLTLITVDGAEECKRMTGMLASLDFDVLVSCSWRYKVPLEILNKAHWECVNLHRGRLPQYAGAEPVRRALENGDAAVAITAHRMIEEIDAGETLAVYEHAAARRSGESLSDATERVKRELVPHYPRLMAEAIDKVESEYSA